MLEITDLSVWHAESSSEVYILLCGEKLLRATGWVDMWIWATHTVRVGPNHVLPTAASSSVLCILWGETGAVGQTCDSVRQAQPFSAGTTQT